MGFVTVPDSDLPYDVHLASGRSLESGDYALVERVLDETALAYIGESAELNHAVARRCLERGIPYVVTTEYTLRTNLDIMRAETRSPVRRAVKELRFRIWNQSRLRVVARAAEVHTNGYPTYAELAKVNPRRVLFFDTRAMRADIVPETAIRPRLASLRERPARLLYSGRYHPMKGALDVVKTGLELIRLGFCFRLDTFGAGPLKDQMIDLVRRNGADKYISVHDPVPYRPTLIQKTREADLFVACHVQGDPSCTYLETFACGVPIAGYANEMWSALQRESQAGFTSPVHDHRLLANAIAMFLEDTERVHAASMNARAFAFANTMEAAWDRRTARLAALAGSNPPQPGESTL